MSVKTHSVPCAALQGLSYFLGCGLMAFLSLMPQNFYAYPVSRGMVGMKSSYALNETCKCRYGKRHFGSEVSCGRRDRAAFCTSLLISFPLCVSVCCKPVMFCVAGVELKVRRKFSLCAHCPLQCYTYFFGTDFWSVGDSAAVPNSELRR